MTVPKDFKTRIARAYLKGEGQAVFEMWRAIAQGSVLDNDALKWVREIALFIVGDAAGRATPPSRLEKIHTSLAVSGFAEPQLDTLDDEQLLLVCAMEGLRGAAEQIWRLIGEGKATHGIREQWLDHVSAGVSKFLQSSDDVQSNRRGDALLKPLGLAGKKKASARNDLVAAIFHVMQKFPSEFYASEEHRYISTLITRLEQIGAISGEDGKDPNLARLLRERWIRPTE